MKRYDPVALRLALDRWAAPGPRVQPSQPQENPPLCNRDKKNISEDGGAKDNKWQCSRLYLPRIPAAYPCLPLE